MNMDRWISLATMAGLIGLLILHPSGAETVIKALGSATTGYISAVQGR